MTTYAEIISSYPQIDPAKFNLLPRPASATKEMVETAEKVVAALVNARDFRQGFGGPRARESAVIESGVLLNMFVRVANKQALPPEDLIMTKNNCNNLALYTDAPLALINQYAQLSGYHINWSNRPTVVDLSPKL